MYNSRFQGMLDVGDAPPPSLLEDPDIELGDLATVAYVERGWSDFHSTVSPLSRIVPT